MVPSLIHVTQCEDLWFCVIEQLCLRARPFHALGARTEHSVASRLREALR